MLCLDVLMCTIKFFSDIHSDTIYIYVNMEVNTYLCNEQINNCYENVGRACATRYTMQVRAHACIVYTHVDILT